MDPATSTPPLAPDPNGTQGIPSIGPLPVSAQGPAPFNPVAGPISGAGPLAPPPTIMPGQPYLGGSVPPSFPEPGQAMDQSPMAPIAPIGPDLGAGPLPQNARTELVEKLRTANNVLVTVSSNPTVDQLAAAIGITLVLNKLDKHATAVYSGQTPPAIEFLEPSKTIEKNTDSLRDFIIALDKAKADKLRYKVEDKFVKIFITPYHTSLSESDLEFSQGDFNVDVVLALGVHKREELDQAITAHGRILHDAVTVSVNNEQPSDLGAINWFQADASSLCEMLVGLTEPLQGDRVLVDQQVATAFLTGVVAETERFSNSKTTPLTMNVSATLMKAGANQQLVSSKLETPQPVPQAKGFDNHKLDELAKEKDAAVPTVSKDGSLEIDHKKETEEDSKPSKSLQDLERENKSLGDDEYNSDLAKIHIDEDGKILSADKPAEQSTTPEQSSSNMVMQPPSMGGALSAAMQPQDQGVGVSAVDTPSSDDAPLEGDQAALQHAKTITPLSDAEKAATLSDIEQAVHSAHAGAVASAPVPSADNARQAVEAANAAVQPGRLGPVDALNAQPIPLENSAPVPQTTEEAFPTQLIGPDRGLPPDPTAAVSDPSAPPPVPPPMMPLQ